MISPLPAYNLNMKLNGPIKLLALLSSKLCRTSVAVDYGWAVLLFGFALAWVVHWISKSSHALGRLSILAPGGAKLEGGAIFLSPLFM
jgi:hypothetical protein